MNLDDTILALATPPGKGAIAVIRLSGKEAISQADTLFMARSKKKLQEVPSHTLHLGNILYKDRIIDEVLVSVFHGPHSYTGENVVEISCHGSSFIQQELIRIFLEGSVRMAEAGEFTLRAFLNGKMDLTQAEAVADLIASEGAAAHRIAIEQMRGGISKNLEELRLKLVDFASLIELELDFSEEDVAFADRSELNILLNNISEMLKNLIDSFTAGNAIKNGIPVAIAGLPNAGKSSLLNALLNEEKAIVSEIAGTTRDSIEDSLFIDGIEFRFIDTAGLRETNDKIEAIGVARAKEKITLARLLLYVYDPAQTQPDQLCLRLQPLLRDDLKVLLVHNKSDQKHSFSLNEYQNQLHDQDFIKISALQKKGLQDLKKWLTLNAFKLDDTHHGVVSNSRHYESLQLALEHIQASLTGLDHKLSSDLLAIDIRQALYHIGMVTGTISTDDLLGNIFANFCIGK